MIAKDFVGKGICEVRVINPKLNPANYSIYFSSYNFPGTIVIYDAVAYDTKRIYISFYNKTIGNYNTYVPNDFEFELLPDGENVLAYEEYILRNIATSLNHSFNVGCDPEMFVENESGEVIPAFNFLGSKENPNTTFVSQQIIHGGTKMYWDGFQAEFETHPNNCLGWHTDSVYCGIKGLYDAAKRYNPKAVLSLKTTMDISQSLLDSSAEEHVQFGCMPSYNVYGMKGLERHGRTVPFRSAGGHIHYGLGKVTHEQAAPIVLGLDAILAVACVSLFANYDDPRRRSMYGLAGEYRLPAHGLEYRVLSNAWMAHPAIMNLVFDVSRKVIMFSKKGLLKYWQHKEEETIDTINTCNVEAARASLERNKDLFIKIISAYYGTNSHATLNAYKAFYNGMESVLENPTDIESNWLVKPDMLWVKHAGVPGKNWATASDIISVNKKVV